MTIATHHRRRPATAGKSDGFTLVEILIAVSIIVLMIGLALPAFRAITGSRSVEGATNNVSAMLGRARTDAIGLQQDEGVAFYTDPAGQCRMAEVAPVVFQSWTKPANLNTAYLPGQCIYFAGLVPTYYVCTSNQPANSNVDISKGPLDPTVKKYWYNFAGSHELAWAAAWSSAEPILYDIVQGTDAVPLPLGIAAQVIADGGAPLANAPRTADGYLHNGILQFDGQGRLNLGHFVVSQHSVLGRQIGSDLAVTSTGAPIPTSFGLVLYDRDAHSTQNFPAQDPTVSGVAYTSGTPAASDEETWLDANATPLLINRYTGTLVRGE